MKKYIIKCILLLAFFCPALTGFSAESVKQEATKSSVVVVKQTNQQNTKIISSKKQILAEKKQARIAARNKAKEDKIKAKAEEERLSAQIKQAKIEAKQKLADDKVKAKAEKAKVKADKKQAKIDAKQKLADDKVKAKAEEERLSAQIKQAKIEAKQKHADDKVKAKAEKTKVITDNKQTKVQVKQTEIKPDTTKEVIEVKPVTLENQKQAEKSKAEVIKVSDKKVNLNDAKDFTELKNFFSNFESLHNKHSLYGLKKLYTDDFINTDGYTKIQLFELISRAFSGYPDIKTSLKIKDIVVSSTFAMVTAQQTITATTKDVSQITGDKGLYEATIENIYYLKKYSDSNWKIYAETVLFESSKLSYGMANGVNATVTAPQKVLADTDYSAGVKVNVPDDYSAIASVNNTQLTENTDMKGETFRQVSLESNSLERVLRANINSNNEAVVISVGFTKMSHDMFKKPKIDISGLMILMQRVDVIPKNSNFEINKNKKTNDE